MTGPVEHTFWMLVLSVLLIGVSVALSYLSRWEAVLAAYAAIVAGYLSRYVNLEPASLWFWLAATAIVVGINFLLPAQVRGSKVGLPFFATGALVGAFIGMLLNSVAGVITACAIGTLLGAVAFSRMPGGAILEFPSQKFFNYLYAKGLPLVVIYSMLGILSLQLIVISGSL